MIRLNNKDFSEVELEHLLRISQMIVDEALAITSGDERPLNPLIVKLKSLVTGTTRESGERNDEDVASVDWQFKFHIVFTPRDWKQRDIIQQAMRSPMVNHRIREQFNVLVENEIAKYLLAFQTNTFNKEEPHE